MYQLSVLYTPETEENKKLINNLVELFVKKDFKARVKKANDSSIVDILSSNIFIFGLNQESAANLPPEFKEIIRALSGVNLAGRVSAFISFGEEELSSLFKKALKDTNTFIYEDELIFFNGKIEKKRLKNWASALYQVFKDNLHED
jgi:flavodoxin